MPKRHALAAALLAALVLPGAALAQQAAQPASDQDDPTEIDKVTVTGSRIKRAEVEGPSPVTIISAQQIEREGFNTVYDALTTLTQASGSVQNEIFQNGFTPNASVINLRGLGPGRTLLLINGRRAADYPLPYNGQSNFQNFGNIPAAAVERIEILAGGASAIYGSDAVAGVVNVVLKTNYEGDVVKLRGQTSTRGGRDLVDLQWIGGKTGDNWSLTYAFEYYYSEPLFAYQREFMDSIQDNPLPPAFGGNQPIGTMRLRNRTRTTNNYIAPPAGACEQFGDEWVRWNYVSSITGATLGQSCGTFKDVGYQTIANKNDDLSGYVHGTFDFDNGMQAWASLQAWTSDSASGAGTQFWAGPTVGQIWFDPQFNTFVDAQRVFTPQESGGVENLMSRYDERSYDFAFGLRGTIADRFDWDVTLSRAEYDIEVSQPRFVASAVNSWFLGAQQGTRSGFPVYSLNLDRYYRGLTPAEFAALSTQVKTKADSHVNQASFVLTGDLFQLPAGPLGFAGVVEAASQEYDLQADPRILPDRREIYNLTGTGGGGERDRYAVGVEFSIPILQSLKASLAGRYDKYEDVTAVDDAKTWNAGLEWRPIDNLLIRGSYSTSFRAPDMHYVFAQRSGAFSTIFDTRRCLQTGRTAAQCGTTDPTYSYTAFSVRQGSTGLEEETGKSWTAGLVWDITDGLSFTADYYEIELEGVVADISTTFILDSEAGCVTGLTRNRTPFQYASGSAFCQDILSRVSRINAPNTTQDGQISEIRRGPINRAFLGTKGVDASLDYRLDTDRWGNFRWVLGWSHTLEQTSQEFSTDPVLSYRDLLTNFDFRSRVRSTWTWEKGDWEAAVFMLRYGSLPNWQETGRIAPYFVWNVGVGKKLTQNLSVSVQVNNVFDKLHPRDEGFNSYPYFWRAYSPIGREIGAEIQYKF
ncbi:MAG TPA: TonB-dependent receptor [Lysobacter sp.]|nr:TonB-dependent receptor [Lysobacter sp.]